MHRDVQASPGRVAATSMLRSALAGLVLLSSMVTVTWVWAQEAPKSEVPPAVQTAPGSPAVPSAVDNKPASPRAPPLGNPSGPTGPTAQTIGSLPRDLSPWSMFLNADIVVKTVMIGLAFASVVTWTIWLAKGLELVWAKRRARAATRKLRHAKSLADGARGVQSGWTRNGPVAILVDEAINEARLSEDCPLTELRSGSRSSSRGLKRAPAEAWRTARVCLQRLARPLPLSVYSARSGAS